MLYYLPCFRDGPRAAENPCTRQPEDIHERDVLRFFERDLRVKITTIFIVLVLFATGAAFLVSYVLVNRIVRDNIEASMLDSARMTTNLLEVALERRQSRMLLLSDYPVLRDPAADTQSKCALLSVFTETWPIGKGAVLLDTAGNVECTTPGVSSAGNVSGTSWFQNAQTARMAFTYVNDPAELAALGYDAPVLAVSTPIRDPKDQIYAYVVAFTHLDDIRKAIDGVRIGRTGHAFLIESGGQIVAGSLFQPGVKPTTAEDRGVEELVRDITRGGSGRTTTRYGKDLYIVTYTPVAQPGTAHPELDLSVAVIVRHSEAYGPAHRVAWSLVALSAALLIAAIIASILLGRSITRPITELAASAERIGSGDLTGEVVISTRDQIGTLAAAFLRMRDYLRSTLGEAGRNSDRMSVLADDQSAAAQEVFSNIEDIVDSVVVLAKTMESQTLKIQQIMGHVSSMPPDVIASPQFEDVRRLVEESEVLAEAGAAKAVEIATASQDQRSAVRDVAAAARRLSEMAAELREMVSRFKI